MQFPSLTTILSVAFLGYMAHSLWSMAQLFMPPGCTKGCLSNALTAKPDRDILIFTSTTPKPGLDKKDLSFVKEINVKDPKEPVEESTVDIVMPDRVKRNGSMFLCVFTVPGGLEGSPIAKASHKQSTYTMVPLTVFHIPEAETFNLLTDDGGDSKEPKKQPVNRDKPVTHLRSKVAINMLADDIDIPRADAPQEFYYIMRVADNGKSFLPIVYIDELSLRLRDLRVVNKTDAKASVAFSYEPISYGKLRLSLQFTGALASMHSLGFTDKDTDEVKGIFTDTNIVLLLVTFGVSAVHLLFDFLAFKNDISFWRGKETMEGLSTTTVLWRGFSQAVIFLYLLDEETSYLVLIPSGVAAVIELWKVKKVFKFSISWSGGVHFGSKTDSEKSTGDFDNESLKYLSYVLAPLCIGGAVYSLLYTPHKSWYSWTIQSTVNGVYAFGFLFMLPQLFVNYKLKSVAHLPWRAFMYKAFNTFIDDLFAFIITMPTAHRVACFRDDIVFLVYLYQRYLYPVDKTRIDVSGMIEETPEGSKAGDQKEKKE